jgi:hypothetical protein
MPDTGPYHDPKPTQVPVVPTPPAYLPDLTRQQVIDRVVTALLTALAAVIVPWLMPFTRPPATDVTPTAPVAIQAQRGQAAAAALVDFGLLEE